MVDVNQLKTKIIEIIKIRGPSLPIQIAKELGINSLFTSAFLSELIDEKRIKISSLKVGGSHLYFLEGQEFQLEKFHIYLHPKEAEAFILLKKNKILKDSEQESAIRVALRSIKDFAESFEKDNEIYWKSVLVSESEIIEMIKTKIRRIEAKPKERLEMIPIMQKIIKIKKESLKAKPKKEIEFQNPLAVKPIEKPKKEKPKSEFALKIIEFMNKNNYKILEEKEFKAKEYNALVQIDSDLGPITFLAQAKDKKSASEDDLKKLLMTAQSIPLPAFFIFSEELSKKAKELLGRYPSILKAKRIE